jgi:hypothetical protein
MPVNTERLKVPPLSRKIAKAALDLRLTLSSSRRAGTAAGLATAKALAEGTDGPMTHRAIRMFWPRWTAAYMEAMGRGLTPSVSKVLLAGDLWGGLPMLETIQAERKVQHAMGKTLLKALTRSKR